MDLLQSLFFLLVSFATWACIQYVLNHKSSKMTLKTPPGPKPFPLIGNILEIGNKPHQSLANLSKIYGPLMYLMLGSKKTIVVSSSETAKMVLQKHDQVLSNRPHPESVRVCDHHRFSVAWVPIDHQWRKLRKICKEQLFSRQMLDASQSLRTEKLRQLWEYVNDCSVRGRAVDISGAAFTTSLNLLSASLLSMELASYGSDSSEELKELLCGIMELIGKPNYGDYFPIIKKLDLQGIFRKNELYTQKCLDIFDEIIQKRLQEKRDAPAASKNDMLEAMLHLNQQGHEHPQSALSFDDIKHLLLDLFAAGTDTSAGTVEWAMTELLRHPDKMLKLRSELRSVIGENGAIQESDITRLPYLQAVIKETFRLHPTAPLLLPHKCEEDMELNGFLIPKNAQILVNVYAIGRDSNRWSDPQSFNPERFLELESDPRGQHFELIPFGAGRRICIGMPLAYRMVHLVLATMVNNFEWKVERGEPQEIDMTEKFGSTLVKAIPLTVVPFKV